ADCDMPVAKFVVHAGCPSISSRIECLDGTDRLKPALTPLDEVDESLGVSLCSPYAGQAFASAEFNLPSSSDDTGTWNVIHRSSEVESMEIVQGYRLLHGDCRSIIINIAKGTAVTEERLIVVEPEPIPHILGRK